MKSFIASLSIIRRKSFWLSLFSGRFPQTHKTREDSDENLFFSLYLQSQIQARETNGPVPNRQTKE